MLERPQQKQEKPPETKIYFIRHSRASYATYAERLASDTPELPIDTKEQLPDLPEAGVELAEKSAHEFLSKLDPKTDIIYIVSSNQMRALETAQIYAKVAGQLGIEVVEQESQTEDKNFVRPIETISLKNENPVLDAIFSPVKIPQNINWEAVSPETKAKYDQVRGIVLADDKGSWGANFYTHSEEVKKVIPEIETSQELYERQYKKIERLAQFAQNKANGEKRVNVLAFGHENYMSVALQENTGDHSIGNTETIEILEDGSLKRLNNNLN